VLVEVPRAKKTGTNGMMSNGTKTNGVGANGTK
jgi:hypothetical protein